MSERGVEALGEVAWLRAVTRIRALVAMAQSSQFPPEAQAYADKATALTARHGVDPALLEVPTAPVEVVMVGIELRRLHEELMGYRAENTDRTTRTPEWAACITRYDEALEFAALVLNVPVPRLPTGSRRRFRPEEQAEIEGVMALAGYEVRVGPGGP